MEFLKEMGIGLIICAIYMYAIHCLKKEIKEEIYEELDEKRSGCD
jgi:hypothetical protein